MEQEELYAKLIEVFDIDVDSYAGETTTMGDLHDYVLWKLGLARRDVPCLCPPTFFALRAAMAESLDTDRDAIKPETSLAELIPIRKRRSTWRQLTTRLGWRFPDLEDPPGLVVGVAFLWALGVFPLSIFLIVCLAGKEGLFMYVGIALTLLSQVPFAIVMSRLFRPLQVRIPHSCRTVGELVECVVSLNAPELQTRFASSASKKRDSPLSAVPQPHRCTYTAAFLALRKALASALGMRPRLLRPHTPLAHLIPPLARRKCWRNLRAALRWRLPGLLRAPWVVFLCASVYLVAIGVCARLASLGFAESVRMAWLFLFPYAIVAHLATRPFAIHPPTNCATFGDLTHAVINENYGRIARQYASASPDEVWSVLCAMVSGLDGRLPKTISRDMPLSGDEPS
jgi:hypothetical protein